MAKTGVKVTGLDKLTSYFKRIQKPIDKKTSTRIAKRTMAMMRSSVSKGVSPIKGDGRFKAYKQSYKDQIKGEAVFWTNRYGKKIAVSRQPRFAKSQSKHIRRFQRQARASARETFDKYFRDAGIKGKKIRPVNLKLSGKFLKQLRFKNRKWKFGYIPEIGFFNRYSIRLEKWHREGASGQEKRPMIPSARRNERFSVKIQRMIRKEIKSALDRFKKTKS